MAGLALALLGVGVVPPGCADVTSPADYAALVEQARACASDDECVLAGAGPCTCATPVNAALQADVDEAAAEVDCRGAVVECATHANLVCDAGRCSSQ